MADRKRLKRESLFRQLANDTLNYFHNVRMSLWPNEDQSEIWFHSKHGNAGFAVTVSEGKSGLSIRIRRFAGAASLTLHGNKYGDLEVLPMIEMDEVAVTQYFGDERSQWFKKWYNLSGTPKADTTKDANARLAYANGKAMAKAGKTIEESVVPEDEAYRNTWLDGYYSQMAGMIPD